MTGVMLMQEDIKLCRLTLCRHILPDRWKGIRSFPCPAVHFLRLQCYRTLFCFQSNDYAHLRRPALPLQSKEDHTGEQCSKSCKLVTSPYEGEPDQLSGQCGCVAPHRACSAEFNEGVVRELCDALGNRAFATAFTDSEGAMAAGAVRRLQKSKDLSLLATAE